MYLAYNSVAVEVTGKPVVMLCQESFVHDAKAGAAARHMPGLRIVATTIRQGTHDEVDAIRAGLPVDKIIAAMTAPLTAEEKAPALKKETPKRIIFKGSLKDVNRFFYKRGWSAGLPVIPPTEEEVREMLHGTDLPPEHVVAKLPLKSADATVEKIAVNAVMAGALPTYMPVLIAGVQALVDQWEWPHAASTLMSVAPLWVINGPVRNDIFVNSGRSLLSSGIMANAVIARAMYLIIRNIGGVYRPGIDMMNYFGHPGTSTMCFAENEEQSPWEPLHVSHGLNKEDSAVSLFLNTAQVQVLAGQPKDSLPKNSMYSPEQALEGMLMNLRANFAGGKGMGGANCLFLLSPGAAKILADGGWTKQKIYSFLLEEARKMPRSGTSKEKAWGPPEEGLRIIVAGGTIDYAVGYQFNGGFDGWRTKKLELPAKWQELVKKYNVLPAYELHLLK